MGKKRIIKKTQEELFAEKAKVDSAIKRALKLSMERKLSKAGFISTLLITTLL